MLFLGMKVNKAKSRFFDREAVRAATTRGERKALVGGGSYLRKVARRMLRRRKRTANPGQAPSNRTGLIKRMIFFVFSFVERSVIVGPTQLNSASYPGEPDDALEVLEYGGRTKRRLWVIDEVTRDDGRDEAGRFVSAGTRTTKIRRSRDAPLVAVEYDPHPFMGPALEKAAEKGKLAELWQDSIS